MDLIKDIGKSLNFKERYDGMDRYGMEEYDKDDCKELRELEKSGAPLSESQKETLKYCTTMRSERTRAAMNLGMSGAKVATGLATGNHQLATQGVTDAAGYVMSEAGEVDGPNDGTGQELGKQDLFNAGSQLVQGAMTFAGHSKGGEATPDLTGTDTGAAGLTGGFNMTEALNNPEFQKYIQNLVQQQVSNVRTGFEGMADMAGAKLSSNGRRNRYNQRTTRNHSYIKGNTRGFK